MFGFSCCLVGWNLACATPQHRRAQRRGAPENQVSFTLEAVPPLPFVALRIVPRRGGGAFVLGGGGELARVDRRGKLSSVAATPLRDLSASAQFVCGTAADASLYCLVDHHEDYACSGELPGPTLLSVQGAPPGSWRRDPVTDALCTQGPRREISCFRITASCEQHCLAFPPCETPRCVDPCAPGEAPHLRASAWPTKISLSPPPLAVTDR